MKCNDFPKEMHLELLEPYCITIDTDGKVFCRGKECHAKETPIGYRDEGPDAWSSSTRFEGPAWVWTESPGWEYYKNGVTITGYDGLHATVINIKNDVVTVAHCYGQPY